MLSDEERVHVERLLKIYQRNLQTLETQAASFGDANVPVGIVNQISDTRDKIAELQAKLGPPEAAPASPASPGPPSAGPAPANGGGESAPPTEVTLDFQPHKDGAQITWRGPAIGRESSNFEAPYDDVELALVIRALDVAQYPNYPIPNTTTEQKHFAFSEAEQEILIALNLWKDGRVVTNAYQVVGDALFRGLGAAGQGVLKRLRDVSTAQRTTTSYMLRFPREAINLAALPWEALWNSANNQAVLIRGNSIDSCERYVDVDQPIRPPLPAGRQLRALALSPTYRIPEEIRQAERAARLKTWDNLKAEGLLVYDEIAPLTMTSLNDYLFDAPARPDIVHFFGHGVYRGGKGFLQFDDGQGGCELISAERLAAVLGDVRLVVLHACQSAMVDDAGGLLTGVAPALSIETGAVVAMQLTVAIPAATRFSQIFYGQLLRKRQSLQDAVARGRQVLFTEASDGASWYVPTLYIRGHDQQPVYLIR